jgi:hypothetical protein
VQCAAGLLGEFEQRFVISAGDVLRYVRPLEPEDTVRVRRPAELKLDSVPMIDDFGAEDGRFVQDLVE